MSPQGAPLALGTARSTTDVHISPRDAEETGSRSATPGRGETSFAPVSREPGHVQAALNRCRNHEDAVAPAAALRCSRTAPSGYRRSEQQWPAGGRIGDKRVLFRSAKGLGHSLIWMCFVGQLACDCRGSNYESWWRCSWAPSGPRIRMSSTASSTAPNQCGFQVVNSTASPGAMTRSASPSNRRIRPCST